MLTGTPSSHRMIGIALSLRSGMIAQGSTPEGTRCFTPYALTPAPSAAGAWRSSGQRGPGAKARESRLPARSR